MYYLYFSIAIYIWIAIFGKKLWKYFPKPSLQDPIYHALVLWNYFFWGPKYNVLYIYIYIYVYYKINNVFGLCNRYYPILIKPDFNNMLFVIFHSWDRKAYSWLSKIKYFSCANYNYINIPNAWNLELLWAFSKHTSKPLMSSW